MHGSTDMRRSMSRRPDWLPSSVKLGTNVDSTAHVCTS